MERDKRKTLGNTVTLVAGNLLGVALGLGAICHSERDRSPYGKKTYLPPSFYGMLVKLGDLNPEIRDAYLDGYLSNEDMIKILDGEILNIAPVEARAR